MKRFLAILLVSTVLAGCLGGEPDETPPVQDDHDHHDEPVDILDEEVALARSLLIEEPKLLLEGPLQTFGNAIASYDDGNRLAVASVIGGDYFVQVSDDAGRTWSDAVQATDGAGATTHSAQAASIDFGGLDEIHISYSGSGINHVVSTDGGLTWSAPTTIDGTSGLDGFTDMGANEAGRVAIIWLRGQTEGGTGAAETVRGYYGAISEDAGATWTVEQFPGDNEPCDCCSASVVMRDDGTAFGMWRNIYNPGPDQERDYTLTVNVPGQGWSEPQRLEPSGWKFNGCPASASAMSLAPDGTVTATWWTGAAESPGYHLGQVAPGETNMVTKQALQADAPASASASATDGRGNAWALWADERTNPTTLRLAREEAGTYEVLGSFEGDWPRMAGTPDGFVAVYMDADKNLQILRGSTPLSPAVIDYDVRRGDAPLTVNVELKGAAGVNGTWAFQDGLGNNLTGDQLPHALSVTYDEPGTYTMRFTIDDGTTVHESVVPVVAQRPLVLPDPASFSAGQPLVSCNGGCASMDAGPDAPPVDGFWVPLDASYWGLIAAAEGDVQNIGGDGTATVVLMDADLNELASGTAVKVPEGTAWAFVHGNFSIWGGSAVYEDMTVFFSLPGVHA